ncbi:MAG: alkyl sulfatase dimerization domain-containing protein, partial [Candidatus Binataceae bacterium]
MIKELAEKLWNGEASVREHSPFAATGEFEEVADGVAFFRYFANFTAIKTGEGLVLVDTGSPAGENGPVALLRQYSPARIHTAIYTHGHIDHVGGMTAFAAEAQHNRSARPRIVAHRAIADRFDRYRRTAGYNAMVNSRQFQRRVEWPAEYVYPDTPFDHQFNAVAGNHKFECHHARGETDDHCWIYLPAQKVLFTGDFIIWATPNAGNPSKVQRYAREWAEALRAMAKTDAEVLIPGHGLPVFGKLRVRQMLNDTAEYLRSINEQALALLNDGAPLDAALHQVKPPAALQGKPYLQAIYDEPEYIVRNIYRLEGGWYDGAPSHLKPASESEQAGEIAALAGGVTPLVARAMGKFNAGNLALACHLIDWAYSAAPDDPAVNQARMQIYATRAEQSPALMTRGIFRAAVAE